MHAIPETLAAFVAADWTMDGLCVPCDGIDKKPIDMAAARDRLGADYPTRAFMLGLHCPKCGRKLSLYDRSPDERKPIAMPDDRKWRPSKPMDKMRD